METPPPSAPPTINYSPPPATDTDRQHLKLLAIFYYVMAGLQLLGSCAGLFYLGFGIFALSAPPDTFRGPNDPENIGTIMGGVMIGVGAFILLLTLVFGILQVIAGNNLRKMRGRTLCFVVAGLTCLSVPLGTVLGVFTFVVLSRASVARMFVENKRDEGANGATYR